MSRRRLLYLAGEFPVPVSSASRLRTYNWIVHLSKHFDLTLFVPAAGPIDPVHLEAVTPYCRAVLTSRESDPAGPKRFAAQVACESWALVRGLPPSAWVLRRSARQALLRLGTDDGTPPFDVVFADSWMWGSGLLALGAFSVLDTAASRPRAHAVHRHARNPLRRALWRPLGRAAAREERRMLAAAGLVLTPGPATRRAVRVLRGDRNAVSLPPGLCTQYFAPRRIDTDPSNVLFYGPLREPEQRDALLRLHGDIMPFVRQTLPHARLTVVGEAPPQEFDGRLDAESGLHFTGPLEDERIALWTGAVAALPLRFGRGARGRVAQLLALGIPVVTTPAGVAGLDVRSGDGVLIVPDGPDFGASLSQVLTDRSLRDDLSRRAREVAESRLSIAATYDRMAALLARAPAVV